MKDFKVGEKVICIEISIGAQTALKLGKVYTVEEVRDILIKVKRLNWWWHECRFVKYNKLLKVLLYE